MDLLNRIMIAGRLTRDPEVRETTNGKKVAKLGLALDQPGSGKQDANAAAEAIFVDVEVWNRTAETASEYLRKGSAVIVDGRLKMDRWEDRETGKVRRKLLVVGERLKFLNLASSGRGTRDEPQGTGQPQGNGRREPSDTRR